jgi:hypothetical protein
MTDQRTPIRTRFARHDLDPDRARAIEEIRGFALRLAACIDGLAPECHERDDALDALDACVMWANAGIARHGASVTPTPAPTPELALFEIGQAVGLPSDRISMVVHEVRALSRFADDIAQATGLQGADLVTLRSEVAVNAIALKRMAAKLEELAGAAEREAEQHGMRVDAMALAVDDACVLYGVSEARELDETVAEALARAVVLDVGKAPLDGLRRLGLDAADLRTRAGRAGPQRVVTWRWRDQADGGPVVWSAQTYSPDEVFAHLHGFFGLEAGA